MSFVKKLKSTNITDMYKVFAFSSEEPEGQGRDQTYLSLNVFWSCWILFSHTWITWSGQKQQLPFSPNAQRILQFRSFLPDVSLVTWKQKIMLLNNLLFYLTIYPGYVLMSVNIKLPLFIKTAAWNSIVWKKQRLFKPSPTRGDLGCF